MKNSSNTLNYKGFTGSVAFSLEDGCMHGRIEYINDLVTFEAERVVDLKVEFEDAVDDYIETCIEIGKSPDKPMSGSFNVRIGADLHKEIHKIALGKGVSLNDMVKASLKQTVSDHLNHGISHESLAQVLETSILHLRMNKYISTATATAQMPNNMIHEPRAENYHWKLRSSNLMTSGVV
jgi:predicted HicB family RNase H-like nuclease